MVSAINDFYQSAKKNENENTLTLLIPHLNAVINTLQDINISPEIKAKHEVDIYLMLGYINYDIIRNLNLAKTIFETMLGKNTNHLSPETYAVLFKDLCFASLTMNLLDQSLEYCKKSIVLCKNFDGSEYIIADNLQLLGNYYRRNDNFVKSRASYEQAIKVLSSSKTAGTQKLEAEIYLELSMLYLMHYLNKEEGIDAERYIIKALESLSASEIFYPQKPLPQYIICEAARHRWKYAELLIWRHSKFDEAYLNIKEAEYILKEKCPNNMYIKGRILGLLGEIFLRQNKLLESQETLKEAINILSNTLSFQGMWTYSVKMAEVNIRLGNFDLGYEDSLKVIKNQHIEKSSYYDLKYLMAFYNGSFAKYKLKDYQKSIEHFVGFFNGMDKFCKKFLDKEVYEYLLSRKVFIVLPYNKATALRDIKLYLDNSLIIFTTIFGKEHPFVKDYIKKNIKPVEGNG